MVPRVRLERTGLGVGVEVGALVGPGGRESVGATAGGPGGVVADKVTGVGSGLGRRRRPLLVVPVVAGVVVAGAGTGVGSGPVGGGLFVVYFDDGGFLGVSGDHCRVNQLVISGRVSERTRFPNIICQIKFGNQTTLQVRCEKVLSRYDLTLALLKYKVFLCRY